MSEDQELSNAQRPDELSMLKERAKLMGITFSNNIGVDALREKISDKMEGKDASAPDEFVPPAVQTSMIDGLPVKKISIRDYLKADAMKLVRIRVQNLDPKKKDLRGEIFTVANEYIGTIRKFIPYGEATDNGYHVPNVIYQRLKDRKFLNIRVRKIDGKEHVESNWVREFALEVLPQLTQAELRQLAANQAASAAA